MLYAHVWVGHEGVLTVRWGRGVTEGGMGWFYMGADMQGGVAARQRGSQSILHVI